MWKESVVAFASLYAPYVRERTPINQPFKCNRVVEIEGDGSRMYGLH